jgi:RNA polymerase sigma-70 factor (ECF subfamily)
VTGKIPAVRRLVIEEQMTPAAAMRRSPSSPAQDFDEIYRDHAPLVYRTAWGVLGSREDADDVVQTVFLRLLQRESPVEFQKNPGAYLYRAAVNVALDVLKARRRRPVLVEHVEQLEIAAPPRDSCRLDELHQRLYAALDRLTPDARDILILRYMHKQSVADIGNTLGVSRAVVSLRLFRSRARMRKLLQDFAGDQS